MNRMKFLSLTLAIVSASWISAYSKNIFAAEGAKSAVTTSHEDLDEYYTCTMHPQVHMHEPGKCPICGMPLVKVKGKSGNQQAPSRQSQEGLQVNDAQVRNSQLSKYTVIKKDLELSIPVSGRALSSREIAFQIYEADLSFVKTSSEFIGSSISQPEQSLKGRITGIDRLVDPSSRTLRVTGTLEKSANLITESGFTGEIRTTLKNQVVIPIEAVLHTGTRDLVYAFSSDGKVLQRPVQLGAKGQLEYQILSGLKEGDVISTGPNFLLDSEAKLRGSFSTPQCPPDQHWDIPIAMCMPGKASQ